MVTSTPSGAVLGVLAGPLLLLSAAGSGGGGSPDAAPGVVGAAGGWAPSDHAATTPGVRAPEDARVRPRWRWPLAPRPDLLRRFVAPLGPYGPGHRGIDLRAGPGSRVLAVADGVVTHAGRVAGRGTVTVLHAGGLSSTYEPVDPRVAVGERVSAGDVVGVLAPGGAQAAAGHCGPFECLHLGARRGAGYVDPLLLLLGGRVRLLPLGGQPTTG